MKHAQSLLFKVITRSLFVIMLGVSIVFAPNLSIFDESMLPEITQLLKTPANSAIEGNAYYYIHGLTARSDKNPEEVGRAVIKTLQSKHQKGEAATLTDEETIRLYGGKDNGDDTWQAAFAHTNCIARTQSDCFEQLLAQLNDKNLGQTRLLTQLERYNHAVRLPHMIEDMSQLDYASPLPNFFILMKVGELNQAKSYQESGFDGLLSSTQTDMQFWRMVLTDSQTLLGKMVALSSLHRNLDALSYAIKSAPTLKPEQTQQLQTLLKPLSQFEVSMENELIGELRFSVENWKTAPNATAESESHILSYLTQPTASINLYYRQTLKPAFMLSKMTAPEFYEHAQQPIKAPVFSRINPYNLGGKIYLSKNWQHSSYIGRTHDLAGIYSLVALQLDLTSNPPQGVIAAIKSSPYKNPYTGKPFDYDFASRTLSFQCFDVKDVCKITL